MSLNYNKYIYWFCGTHPAELNSAVKVKMHRVTGREYNYPTRTVFYNKTTINVPRCKKCKSIHLKQLILSIIGSVVTFFIIYGLLYLYIFEYFRLKNPWMLLSIIIILLITGLVMSIFIFPRFVPRASGIKSVRYKIKYPVVQDFKKNGWKFGKKPST